MRSSTSAQEDLYRQRRTEIVDAAERCVKVRGLHQLTLRDIAREYGKSLGNIYNYFPNKEAIIEALVERESMRFMALTTTPEDDRCVNFLERLERCAVRLVESYLDPEGLWLSIFSASEALVNERVRKIVIASNKRMQEYLLRQILVDEAHAEAEMTPERVRELEVQIVLTRTFCESLRGARFFHPDLDLEILKREAVRRIVDNTLSAMARGRGLTIPELLQRKSAELRRSLQTRS